MADVRADAAAVSFEDTPPELERHPIRQFLLMIAPFTGLAFFFLFW